MSAAEIDPRMMVGTRLVHEVFEPMKAAFVGKDEVIDALGVALVAGENLCVIGPPGTGKSAIVRELGRQLSARIAECQICPHRNHCPDLHLQLGRDSNDESLRPRPADVVGSADGGTRATDGHIFGPPFDRRIANGFVDMDVAILDEWARACDDHRLLNAFDQRDHHRVHPMHSPSTALVVVGTTTELPHHARHGAMIDRFALRVQSENVAPENLLAVLDADWNRRKRPPDANSPSSSSVTATDVRELQRLLPMVNLAPIRQPLVDLIVRLRYAGIPISDRHAINMQRVVAASAVLAGRWEASIEDFWVFRHVWDHAANAALLDGIVADVVGLPSVAGAHSVSQSKRSGDGDAAVLAQDLERINTRLSEASDSAERNVMRERLKVLHARSQAIEDDSQRTILQARIADLSNRLDSYSQTR